MLATFFRPLYQLGPYGTRAESQHEKRDLALLKSGTVDPVKPVPTGLRDAGLTTLLRAFARITVYP